MAARPSPATSGKGPIHALTGLRFWAAAAVVFFHYGRYHLNHAPNFVKNMATGGADGVALFFLLSGFVLAYNYADLAERGVLIKANSGRLGLRGSSRFTSCLWCSP